VRVTVLLFARLKEIAGAARLEREVTGAATIGSVWNSLAREYPELGGYTSSVSSAINAEYARMTAAVNDGDEIAFLPPVSGG
jgi:molybdopterin synthase sulfur carrier subunit